jgi:hypothetical protein
MRSRFALLGAALLGACSGNESTGPSPSPGPVTCASTSPTELTPGTHVVIDPATTSGCVQLPAAGPAGAEYLLVALSTAGQVTTSGVSAPYELSGQGVGLAAAAGESSRGTQTGATLSPAQRFHDLLRARGSALAERGATAVGPLGSVPDLATTSPTIGSQRTFQICASRDCTSFAGVTATVTHVGPHSVTYLDNAAPANGYTQADLDRLGSLFDHFIYPIDTTAFGHETDLDGNGAVIILLSPGVNHLSGNCNTSNSVIVGFFFPDDLVPGSSGSNGGEVFYGLVPDPTSSTCTISRDFALRAIGPTFLHEFQHMISFGHHVVLAHAAAEDNWLDEGLSRLAEELGGREIPDSFCTPNTCLSTYPFGDVSNAFDYLHKDTLEASPLIEPGNIDGTLAENGANWLFVRWLADHFASDTVLGTSLTRALDGADSPMGTGRTGTTNVRAVVGTDFPTLVSEWQSANYLTAVPGFTEPTARLRYRSWDFRSVFTATFGSYPLQPDSLASVPYSHVGVLRPGSGRHLRVVQEPSDSGVQVLLSSPTGDGVSPSVVARIAVTRVR